MAQAKINGSGKKNNKNNGIKILNRKKTSGQTQNTMMELHPEKRI